jgi:hypothetical protein
MTGVTGEHPLETAIAETARRFRQLSFTPR